MTEKLDDFYEMLSCDWSAVFDFVDKLIISKKFALLITLQ